MPPVSTFFSLSLPLFPSLSFFLYLSFSLSPSKGTIPLNFKHPDLSKLVIHN